jgi:hypothetical protein
MKNLLLLFFALYCLKSIGQTVRVYGDIEQNNKKLNRVLVTIFENDVFYKKTYSNNKGKFKFRVTDTNSYIALFYKPGYDFYAYKIINKLQSDMQNIYLNIALPKAQIPLDSLLEKSLLLKKMNPKMISEYAENIYDYKGTDDKKERQVSLAEKAIKEDEERKIERKRTNDKETLITTIGQDLYEKVWSNKSISFFKNSKPITEITYNFETGRRFEGVLKKSKYVKKLKRYTPLKK